MAPRQKEPEDIFSETEGVEERSVGLPEKNSFKEPDSKKGSLKIIIIVLSTVAGLLVLAVGGMFAYQRFFADEVEVPPVVSNSPVSPETEEEPSVIPSGSEIEEEVESPPAVPQTPTPDIPEPNPITQEEAPVDSDGDGLSDIREEEMGSDLRSPDTDGDGLIDGDEVSVGADPTVADTDGDGLTDGDEVRVWLTDPTSADTDGDTFADGVEVRNGFDPRGSGRLPDVQ